MIAGSHVVMWVAIDPPGNDACRFSLTSGTLLIEGSSRTSQGAMRYRVRARPDGTTRRARIDSQRARLVIERDAAGRWVLDGVEIPEVAGLKDIDLGFTPATNTLPIRRLALQVGQQAEVVAAWFDPASARLQPLRQTYHRLDAQTYRYASPDHGFEADLTVDAFGAVTRNPGLWTAQG